MTWSPEYSIKNECDFSLYDVVIPSSSNGIQTIDGTLILPTMVVKEGIWYSGIVYLKPRGKGWLFSVPTESPGDNECTVYVDKEEKIILDCRTKEAIRRKDVYDWQKNGWSPYLNPIPVNLKAEITRYNQGDKAIFLTSFCDTEESKRENITLYGSLDAINWKK